MASFLRGLRNFWNNEAKTGWWNSYGFYNNLKNQIAPAVDNWLGTDFTGDRARTRAEEQRRYEQGLARSDNAYLRAAVDMRAAGLNPTLNNISGASAGDMGDPTAGRVNGQGDLGALLNTATSISGAMTNAQQAEAYKSRVDMENNKDAHGMLADSVRLMMEHGDYKERQTALKLENQLLKHDRDIVFGKGNAEHMPWTYKHGPHPVDPITSAAGHALDGFISGKGLKGSAAAAFKSFVQSLKAGNADWSTLNKLFELFQKRQERKQKEQKNEWPW